MNIKSRIEKLEQHSRSVMVEQPTKAERDARLHAFEQEVLPIAAMVRSEAELERYLHSRTGSSDNGEVVDFERHQREASMRKVVARQLFWRAARGDDVPPNAA